MHSWSTVREHATGDWTRSCNLMIFPSSEMMSCRKKCPCPNSPRPRCAARADARRHWVQDVKHTSWLQRIGSESSRIYAAGILAFTALTCTRLKLLSTLVSEPLSPSRGSSFSLSEFDAKDTLTSSSAACRLSSSDPQRPRRQTSHFCYADLHAPASRQPRVSSQMRGCLSPHLLRLPASTAPQLRLHNRYAAAGYPCSLTLTSARLRPARSASVCAAHANERHVEGTRCNRDKMMQPDDSWLQEAADRPFLALKIKD